MGINMLPKNHQLGIEFFRFPNLETLDPDKGYFDCIDLLRPLFEEDDFRKSTPGFYINYITDEDDKKNSMRLTYYSIDAVKTHKAILNFIERNKDKIAIFFSKKGTVRPDKKELQSYEGEEFRFRNFLNAYTKIALDLLKNYGRQQARELVFLYRHYFLPNKIRPESIMGTIFVNYSDFFKQLKDSSLDKQFWEDLVHNFHGKDFGLHFLVNMMAVREGAYYVGFFNNNWFLN
jgi:hypothetical protein